jgi:hypothetical protein
MDNGERIEGVIIEFSDYLYLVPHKWLLWKIWISGIYLRVASWVREFILSARRESEQ